MSGERIEVASAGGGYPVLVGPGLLAALPELLVRHAPGSHHAVISDGTVAAIYGSEVVEALSRAGLTASLHTFPPGEASKGRASWAALTDRLLDAGLDREGVVVALGGGVTGDLAGFVAATYMRGIPVVQVPTSLVAMVDASVGGKTGLDVPGGKNLVGAFHPPRLVLADPEVLRTLPRSERSRGLAEAVKHGAIRDRTHIDAIRGVATALLGGDPRVSGGVVAASVRIKAGVVAEDEREGGVRRILNFGHTLAHAIESVSGFAVSHGEAVAMGMLLEARIGEALGITAPGTAATLAGVLEELELSVQRPGGCGTEALLAATRTDKKGAGGRVRYVLLQDVGRVDPAGGHWVHGVDDEVVRSVLADW